MEKVDIFLKEKDEIVTVKILNLLLLFNGRYWALNTNKWNDKKSNTTKYSKMIKIVTVKILNLLLLFNRRYWALNTNKWNVKKIIKPNIQKQ